MPPPHKPNSLTFLHNPLAPTAVAKLPRMLNSLHQPYIRRPIPASTIIKARSTITSHKGISAEERTDMALRATST
jgi:hypothetical protein